MTISLAVDEIHLWLVEDKSITSSVLLRQYESVLSEEERQKWQRFHFEKDRHQYLITRAALRCLLSRYNNNVLPTEWAFVSNQYGKPSVTNTALAESPAFNLSHTDGLIVIALTQGRTIGVDVECQSRAIQLLDMAKHFFSANEYRHLQSLPAHRQRQRFFQLWTLKEAYIKACGKGLSIPLDRFSFIFNQDNDFSVEFAPELIDSVSDWQFWTIPYSDNHMLALAEKSSAKSLRKRLRLWSYIPLSNFYEKNVAMARPAQYSVQSSLTLTDSVDSALMFHKTANAADSSRNARYVTDDSQ